MQNDEILDEGFSIEDQKEDLFLVGQNKFAILYLLSFGFYGIWWMYKTWKFFKDNKGLDIIPALRAIFGVFFIYQLCEKILHFAKSYAYEKSYSSAGFFAIFIICNLASRLPGAFFLLSFLGVFAFLQPLSAFNFALSKSSLYNTIEQSSFNKRQLIIVIIGSIFWVLVLIGLLVPEESLVY